MPSTNTDSNSAADEILKEVTDLRTKFKHRGDISRQEDRPVETKWCQQACDALNKAQRELDTLNLEYQEAKSRGSDSAYANRTIRQMVAVKDTVFKSVHADLLESRFGHSTATRNDSVSVSKVRNRSDSRKSTTELPRRSVSNSGPSSTRRSIANPRPTSTPKAEPVITQTPQQPANNAAGGATTNINYYYYSGMPPGTIPSPNDRGYDSRGYTAPKYRPASVESSRRFRRTSPSIASTQLPTSNSTPSFKDDTPAIPLGPEVKRNNRISPFTPEPEPPQPQHLAQIVPAVVRKKKPKADPATLCPFCGEKNEEFANNIKRKSHFRSRCPVLTGCQQCNKTIELRHLHEHQMSNCEVLGDALKPCTKCGVPTTPEQAKDGSHAHCVGRKPAADTSYCPLCAAAVKPKDSEEAWRRHLIGYGVGEDSNAGCNNNARLELGGGVVKKKKRKT